MIMKKQYIKPTAEKVKLWMGNLMIEASPGVGGDYDPNMQINAKDGLFDDEEDDSWPNYNIWND